MLEQMRQLLENTSFRPFEIHRLVGQVYRVEHSENAAVLRQHVVVALPGNQNAIMKSVAHCGHEPESSRCSLAILPLV
jgi:hypothetical protein